MAQHHGAATMKEWMDDLVALARSDREFSTSAGAEPGRRYAYLEFHDQQDDHHDILLLRPELRKGRLEIRSYRFEGTAAEVRERVDALVHPR